MIRTTEQMAEDMFNMYFKPQYFSNGVKIHDGFSPMVAAKKAVATNPNFANEIYKLAKKRDF